MKKFNIYDGIKLSADLLTYVIFGMLALLAFLIVNSVLCV